MSSLLCPLGCIIIIIPFGQLYKQYLLSGYFNMFTTAARTIATLQLLRSVSKQNKPYIEESTVLWL